MRSVGLKVLKNKLSEYVRLAAGGETVLVTDRDRIVAGKIAADAIILRAARPNETLLEALDVVSVDQVVAIDVA